MQRDVLRRPQPLAALLEALDGVDRLVLLGDVVELLEGRPRTALGLAAEPLSAIGDAMGAGRDVVLVPGNHDRRLIAPWLRRRAHLAPSERVPASASLALKAVARSLRPARVTVRYPGFHVASGVFAHHGHYVDRELLPSRSTGLRLPGGGPSAQRLAPEDYERVASRGTATLDLLLRSIPRPVSDAWDTAAGLARTAGLAVAPRLDAVLPSPVLAPLTAGALGYQFRRSGLPAMAAVARRLGLRCDTLIFGHLHRAGPLPGDDPGEWQPDPEGPALVNTGSWVYEPLLLAGARAPHAYWPGGAVLVDDAGARPTVTHLGLLDHIDARDLA